MKPWIRLKRIVRFNYLRVLRLKTSAHSIALGCGIGLFVGFLPIIPVQTPVVLTLAFLARANKLAAFLFTFISNPLNMALFYLMLYKVGVFLLPFEKVPFHIKGAKIMYLFETGWRLWTIMFCGGLVLGIPGGIITYFVMLRLILIYRKRRALRLLRSKIHH